MVMHFKAGPPGDWRAGRRRLRRAYRQGDLDGLCGVYSVINAVRALCPEVDSDAAAWLFETLIQVLPTTGAHPSTAVANGIGRTTLASLIAEAISYIDDEYDIGLAVRRLPKALRRTSELDQLWQSLAATVSPTCVAVLGLGGRHSHWTVAVRVSPRQIRLFDSGTMGVLRRSQCTVGKALTRYGISPPHVFLIEREDDE